MNIENYQPLISIIMPVYGVERYLEKAILSVVQQKYKNWELLIINDGSKDKSRDIALKFSTLYKNIYLYDKENGGLSDARNYGLRLAKGEYIHFFDSDDWIENTLYSDLISVIVEANADFVVFGYFMDYCNRHEQTVRSTAITSLDLIYPHFNPSLFISDLDAVLNYAWNKIFKSTFLKKNHLFFEKGLSVIEDQEFIYRAFPLASIVVFSPLVKYHYVNRQRKTLSNSYDNRYIDLYIRSISIKRIFLRKLGIASIEINQVLYKVAFLYVIYLLLLLYASNVNQKRNEAIKIMENSYFSSLYVNYLPSSFKYQLLKNLILHKKYSIIDLFYRIKQIYLTIRSYFK